MPVNLDALIRYHTIDQCLQNRFRPWTWEALAQACFDSLDEVRYRAEKNSVSKRTIENDIRIMRSDILGYNAPIVCKKGLYTYGKPGYSIKNATLSQHDLETISIAAKVLGQYKGFNLYHDLSQVLERVESQAHAKQYKEVGRIIEFERLPDNMGQEHLRPLMDAIHNKAVLRLIYKRFDAPDTREHTLHPYLLKEYRNRWYLLGLNDKHRKITTYALDRIVSYEAFADGAYIENTTFDPQIYFRNTIGITYTGETPLEVTIKVVPEFAPYLLTQPLHESQRLLDKTEDGGTLFLLEVVDNPELRTLLMGYASMVSVVSPDSLRQGMREELHRAIGYLTD